MDKKCSDCRYVEKIGSTYQCRYNPPQPVLVAVVRDLDDSGHALAIWPIVEADEWCGKYEWDNR